MAKAFHSLGSLLLSVAVVAAVGPGAIAYAPAEGYTGSSSFLIADRKSPKPPKPPKPSRGRPGKNSGNNLNTGGATFNSVRFAPQQ